MIAIVLIYIGYEIYVAVNTVETTYSNKNAAVTKKEEVDDTHYRLMAGKVMIPYHETLYKIWFSTGDEIVNEDLYDVCNKGDRVKLIYINKHLKNGKNIVKLDSVEFKGNKYDY